MRIREAMAAGLPWHPVANGLLGAARAVARPATWGYWFAPGCRRSYQCSRIALALMYLYLAYMWVGYPTARWRVDDYLRTLNPQMYRPLGILYFLGNAPPPPAFYKTCLLLLQVCPLTLLFGCFSRLSLAGCVAGLFGLAILQYSFALEWSHGFSPILVTSLPFLLGPRHPDGFDGWLRRRGGKPWTAADDRRARVAVLSVQVMISLVFLNAAYYKWYAYGEGVHNFLPWVFSDNMRNVLVRQHIVFDVPLQDPFRYIVAHEFAYRGMALGNMLAQTLPFCSLFLMRRPWLRLCCGLALASEVIGLGVVMGIWNPHWLLFLAFYLDWDRLVFRRRPAVERPSSAPPARRVTPAEVLHGCCFAMLLTLNVYVMWHHATARQWTFPFTSYPMFSGVVAEKPFRQHLPFYVPISRFEFDSEKPLSPELLQGNWQINWGITWIPDTREVNRQLMTRLEACVGCPFREMKAFRALLRLEEYPGCELREVNKVLVYHYRQGRFQTVTSLVRYDQANGDPYIDFEVIGFQSPRVEVKYFTGEGGGPYALPGTTSEKGYYYRRPDSRKVMAVFEIHEEGKPPVLFGGPLL